MNDINNVNLVSAYTRMLKNYANFSGRSSRAEYWYAVLANAIIVLLVTAILLIPAAILGTDNEIGALGVVLTPFLVVLYALVMLVPSLALHVRRLHDSGKSGWLVLLGFIPSAGGIIMLVLCVLAGDSGENKYGPNPYE